MIDTVKCVFIIANMIFEFSMNEFMFPQSAKFNSFSDKILNNVSLL